MKEIRRALEGRFPAEEKIRIVQEGVHGKESITELSWRAGGASSRG